MKDYNKTGIFMISTTNDLWSIWKYTENMIKGKTERINTAT